MRNQKTGLHPLALVGKQVKKAKTENSNIEAWILKKNIVFQMTLSFRDLKVFSNMFAFDCVYVSVCVCEISRVWLFATPMEIFQARILEWVVISYSRGSSWPRDQTWVSCVSCIAGGFFTTSPLGKPFCQIETSERRSTTWLALEVEEWGALGICPGTAAGIQADREVCVVSHMMQGPLVCATCSFIPHSRVQVLGRSGPESWLWSFPPRPSPGTAVTSFAESFQL